MLWLQGLLEDLRTTLHRLREDPARAETFDAIAAACVFVAMSDGRIQAGERRAMIERARARFALQGLEVDSLVQAFEGWARRWTTDSETTRAEAVVAFSRFAGQRQARTIMLCAQSVVDGDDAEWPVERLALRDLCLRLRLKPSDYGLGNIDGGLHHV